MVVIKPGRLCRLDNVHCGSYNGQIVEYEGHNWARGYGFIAADQSRITVPMDTDFIVLPEEDELRELIEMSLEKRDKAWFQELIQQLYFIRRYKAAKGAS